MSQYFEIFDNFKKILASTDSFWVIFPIGNNNNFSDEMNNLFIIQRSEIVPLDFIYDKNNEVRNSYLIASFFERYYQSQHKVLMCNNFKKVNIEDVYSGNVLLRACLIQNKP